MCEEKDKSSIGAKEELRVKWRQENGFYCGKGGEKARKISEHKNWTQRYENLHELSNWSQK